MENTKNPTSEEFLDSLPNSKIDSMVKVRKTAVDPGISIQEDQYQAIRAAYISGKYKNKSALCKEWGMSIGTLNRILDVTGGIAEACREKKREWSKANKEHRHEYNQDKDVKARKKVTRQRRIENKKRIAQGLEPTKWPRKKPDRNWNKKNEKSE